MTRPTCTFCARKHLSQALVLCEEVQQGYPEHLWVAIGHMAEASAELLVDYPAMAEEIRVARKALEESMAKKQRLVFPDFLKLVERVSALPEGIPKVSMEAVQQVPGKHQAARPRPTVEQERIARHGVPQPPPAASGCQTCMDKARKSLWAAEQSVLGEGKQYPRGRLLILTTLGNFSPSYSLVNVILDQAAAGAAAGYRVTLGVHQGCDLSLLPPLPPAIDVVGIIPRLAWKENDVNVEHMGLVKESIIASLNALGPCKIITHDLIFQSWFCTIAAAIHNIRPMPGVQWFHLCHSSVSPNDPFPIEETDARIYRRTLPVAHNLLILNYADTKHFKNYYHYGSSTMGPPDSAIRVLLNPRDIRTFGGMTALAAKITTLCIPHLVDVAQLYPLSLDRIANKHPEKVFELFSEIKKMGSSVRLIIATAHANAKHHQELAVQMRALATVKGLAPEEVVFTHELAPETAAAGLDRDTIRALFSVTNVFAFPSETEAGSLVLMEAALSGNLLILNESLPCLADYVPREKALWIPWGSLKEAGVSTPLRPVAEQVLDRLESDMSMAAKRHMLRVSSLEHYSERLVEVLGG
jgi:hypothetical protein